MKIRPVLLSAALSRGGSALWPYNHQGKIPARYAAKLAKNSVVVCCKDTYDQLSKLFPSSFFAVVGDSSGYKISSAGKQAVFPDFHEAMTAVREFSYPDFWQGEELNQVVVFSGYENFSSAMDYACEAHISWVDQFPSPLNPLLPFPMKRFIEVFDDEGFIVHASEGSGEDVTIITHERIRPTHVSHGLLWDVLGDRASPNWVRVHKETSGFDGTLNLKQVTFTEIKGELIRLMLTSGNKPVRFIFKNEKEAALAASQLESMLLEMT